MNGEQNEKTGPSCEDSGGGPAVPEFSTNRQEVAIRIDREDYVLVEMMGDEKDAYRDQETKKIKVENGRIAGISVRGTQSSLISICLQKVQPDGTRRPVPADRVRKWPATLQEKLYKECRKLNAFDDVDVEALKNA